MDARLSSFTSIAIPSLIILLKHDLSPVIADLLRLLRERSNLLAQYEDRDLPPAASSSSSSNPNIGNKGTEEAMEVRVLITQQTLLLPEDVRTSTCRALVAQVPTFPPFSPSELF